MVFVILSLKDMTNLQVISKRQVFPSRLFLQDIFRVGSLTPVPVTLQDFIFNLIGLLQFVESALNDRFVKVLGMFDLVPELLLLDPISLGRRCVS